MRGFVLIYGYYELWFLLETSILLIITNPHKMQSTWQHRQLQCAANKHSPNDQDSIVPSIQSRTQTNPPPSDL